MQNQLSGRAAAQRSHEKPKFLPFLAVQTRQGSAIPGKSRVMQNLLSPYSGHDVQTVRLGADPGDILGHQRQDGAAARKV